MAPDFRKPFRVVYLRARASIAPSSTDALPTESRTERSSLINNAIYEDGSRVDMPGSLGDT